MTAPISFVHQNDGELHVPSLDADLLHDDCIRAGIDVDWWYPLANTIKLVAGYEPSEAYLLLQKRYIDGDDTLGIPPIPRSYYDLWLEIADGTTTDLTTIKGWVFHSAHAIDGSDIAADLDTVYLVKFVDRRFLFARQPNFFGISGGLPYMLNVGYNIVNPNGHDDAMDYNQSSNTEFPYDNATTGPSNPWSFEELLSFFWYVHSFTDSYGAVAGILDQDFPSGGVYPEVRPVDIRPENRGTWRMFCDLLHCSGNEIYPKLDGEFRILPIDDHFGDPSALNNYSAYLIHSGYPDPEYKRLPVWVTMAFQFRSSNPQAGNDAITNRNRWYHPLLPIPTFDGTPAEPSDPDGALLSDEEIETGGFLFAEGNVETQEIVPGVLESVTTMAMTYVNGGSIDNGDHLRAFARDVWTKQLKSRCDAVNATYGKFVPLAPSPEFEQVFFSLDPDRGPTTHFQSIPAVIGVHEDSLPDIGGSGGGSGTDRFVAADSTDEVPEELFPKIVDHGTFNEDDYQLVYAELVEIEAGPDPPKKNRVKLFTIKGDGTPGPPGDDGEDGADGADGDTVDEGYAIDVAHAGTVATVSFDPREITSFAASFQFFRHLATDVNQNGADSPHWKTVTNFVDNVNQMFWHQSDVFKFQTTDNYLTAAIDQLLGHVNGQWQWRKIDFWLNKLTGYVSTDNQIIGHAANGATEWKTLASKVINNPTSIELNDLTTTLQSKLPYTPVTFLVWPTATNGTASDFNDSVTISECED